MVPGSDVVDVDGKVIGADLRDDRNPQVRDRSEDAVELSGVEASEDGSHPILLQRLDLVADPRTLFRGTDEDDTAVVRDTNTLDEAPLLHPVDETGGIAQRDVEELGKTTHRELTVMLEHPQDVEVRHADPGFHHPSRPGAAEAADRLVELAHDPVNQVRGAGRGARSRRRRRRDSSHDLNNLA